MQERRLDQPGAARRRCEYRPHGVTTNAGIPGTGLSYRSEAGRPWRQARHSGRWSWRLGFWAFQHFGKIEKAIAPDAPHASAQTAALRARPPGSVIVRYVHREGSVLRESESTSGKSLKKKPKAPKSRCCDRWRLGQGSGRRPHRLDAHERAGHGTAGLGTRRWGWHAPNCRVTRRNAPTRWRNTLETSAGQPLLAPYGMFNVRRHQDYRGSGLVALVSLCACRPSRGHEADLFRPSRPRHGRLHRRRRPLAARVRALGYDPSASRGRHHRCHPGGRPRRQIWSWRPGRSRGFHRSLSKRAPARRAGKPDGKRRGRPFPARQMESQGAARTANSPGSSTPFSNCPRPAAIWAMAKWKPAF